MVYPIATAGKGRATTHRTAPLAKRIGLSVIRRELPARAEYGGLARAQALRLAAGRARAARAACSGTSINGGSPEIRTQPARLRNARPANGRSQVLGRMLMPSPSERAWPRAVGTAPEDRTLLATACKTVAFNQRARAAYMEPALGVEPRPRAYQARGRAHARRLAGDDQEHVGQEQQHHRGEEQEADAVILEGVHVCS